jgi:F-type H+-transporting ATPase subunit b
LHLDPEAAARLFEYLNFAILAGGLLIFLLKYLPGRMKERREIIQKDLLDARLATEQANARLAAVEAKFARLDQEIAEIRSQAEQEGAAEENRMKALLETERQRIVAAAEQEISAVAAAARRELKRFAAGMAVDRAAQKISIDEADDRNLIRQFVQELQKTGREGRN